MEKRNHEKKYLKKRFKQGSKNKKNKENKHHKKKNKRSSEKSSISTFSNSIKTPNLVDKRQKTEKQNFKDEDLGCVVSMFLD